MEQSIFEWKDEYNIGVEKIDDAHKRLFSVVNRIINNFMDRDFEKNKTICIEAVKYLKSYALKHFGEEEAYQLSINYPGYKTHRKIHDNMRDVVIPALEKEVTSKSYSKESLEHFVGTCAGWLAAHVLIEDQAITGKAKSKWNKDVDESSENALNRIVSSYALSLFRMNAVLVNRNYAGFKLNSLFCYSDTFQASDGTAYSAVTAIEESALESAASQFISSTEAFEINGIMKPLISEMLKSFNMEVMMAFLNNSITGTSSRIISEDNFYHGFESSYPDYSMLWRTDNGYIAFCIKKLAEIENN